MPEVSTLVAVLGITISSLYALVAGTAGRSLRQRRPGFARGQRYLMSAVYLALGAAAALTGDRG